MPEPILSAEEWRRALRLASSTSPLNYDNRKRATQRLEAHDAALRAQVVALTEERDEAVEALGDARLQLSAIGIAPAERDYWCTEYHLLRGLLRSALARVESESVGEVEPVGDVDRNHATSAERNAAPADLPPAPTTTEDYHAWQRRNEAPTVYSDTSDDAQTISRPKTCPTCGSDDPEDFICPGCEDDTEMHIIGCLDPFHTTAEP